MLLQPPPKSDVIYFLLLSLLHLKQDAIKKKLPITVMKCQVRADVRMYTFVENCVKNKNWNENKHLASFPRDSVFVKLSECPAKRTDLEFDFMGWFETASDYETIMKETLSQILLSVDACHVVMIISPNYHWIIHNSLSFTCNKCILSLHAWL